MGASAAPPAAAVDEWGVNSVRIDLMSDLESDLNDSDIPGPQPPLDELRVERPRPLALHPGHDH